eukprot:TRINITY_DN3742_c0_g1_i1.p1 TRINITY_DN3742_c0_g1~~TRINITY_DN3742_c0_g1_i1.p1  ORF type:complete len:325 (-),score=71.29 TRINITY_DN3742_c0_g1_i1:20-994(-)
MSVVNDDAFRMETNADSDSDSSVSSAESEGGMLIDEEIMNVTAKAKSAAPSSKETTPTKQEHVDSDESESDEEPKKRGKKRKRGGKDSKVKRPRTAYMYFMQDTRAKVQQDHPDMKFTEVTKEVGKLWSALSAEDKKPYEEKAQSDTKRWEEDKKNAALNPKPDLETLSDISDSDSEDGKGKKMRRPRKKRKTDPNAPKRALTPYIIFLTEQRERVATELKEKDPNYPVQQVLKIVAEQWRALPSDERQKYIDRAEKDKERFKKEKEDYDKKGGPSAASTPTKPVEAKKETTPVKLPETKTEDKSEATTSTNGHGADTTEPSTA